MAAEEEGRFKQIAHMREEQLMKIELYLSICIPTCNRVEILKRTLDSILCQGGNENEYEICISDNSKTDETKALIESQYSNINNLTYCQSDCIGFLNSIEALKLGRGKLLKLHNDYTCLYPGTIWRMICLAHKYEDVDSALFFSMSSKKEKGPLEFDKFDDYMNQISFLSTWSTSFCIWKTDFDALISTKIALNHMYPHTTLLFALTQKGKYIVDEYIIGDNLQPQKKGGYNLLDNFMNIYLAMLYPLWQKGEISKGTLRHIKRDILKFCANWESIVDHNRDCYTFTFENRNAIVEKHYGNLGIIVYEVLYRGFCVKQKIKNFLLRYSREKL